MLESSNEEGTAPKQRHTQSSEGMGVKFSVYKAMKENRSKRCFSKYFKHSTFLVYNRLMYCCSTTLLKTAFVLFRNITGTGSLRKWPQHQDLQSPGCAWTMFSGTWCDSRGCLMQSQKLDLIILVGSSQHRIVCDEYCCDPLPGWLLPFLIDSGLFFY